MKRLLAVLFAFVITGGLLVQDAEAKRLGGGGSFGMSRSSPAVRQAAPTAPTAPAATNPSAAPAPAAQPGLAAPQPARNRWLGPLAGLAAGIGLAALASHFGLGEEVATFMMLALVAMAVMFLFRWLTRRNSPRPAYAGAAGAAEPMGFEPASAPALVPAAAVPAGFDAEGFLRQAKLNFLRLQAANDAGNLDDLKQFLAPEVFAEVQMQYEERGKGKQETDVQQLEAHLLEVVTEGEQHVASVRFSGLIREDGGMPAAFAEVWHLVKPVSGERGWQVAGIQQIQ